jgi:hypothetical protein
VFLESRCIVLGNRCAMSMKTNHLVIKEVIKEEEIMP